MLAYDNKDIPIKEDTAATAAPDVAEAATGSTTTENGSSCSGSSVDQNMKPTAMRGRNFTIDWAAKRKYFNELVATNTAWRKQINFRQVVAFDDWHFFWIIIFTLMAFVSGFCAVLLPNWIWDETSNTSYGLWNTCWRGPISQNITTWVQPFEVNTTMWNETDWISWNSTFYANATTNMGVFCAEQEIYGVNIANVAYSRFVYMKASQGLIVGGICMFFVSIWTLCSAFKFIPQTNLDMVRNFYVLSIIIQVVSFWLVLAGLFVFIYTERMMGGVSILFIYFFLAVFSGAMSFLTVEFKWCKIVQKTNVAVCSS